MKPKPGQIWQSIRFQEQFFVSRLIFEPQQRNAPASAG
jgi:hypothetical protein